MEPIYFIAGQARKPAPGDLEGLGLGHLDGLLGHMTPLPTTRGPGELGGVMLGSKHIPPSRLAHLPDKQTWHPVTDRVQVGLFNEAPAGPDELGRADQLEGQPVTLGDGRAWIVPRAWRFDVSSGVPRIASTLPRQFARNADGEWVRNKLQARYAPLHAIAERWFQAMRAAIFEGDEGQVSAEELPEFATAALAVNYHVGPAEVAALELLTDRTACQILHALTDWETYAAWLRGRADQVAAEEAAAAGRGPQDAESAGGGTIEPRDAGGAASAGTGPAADAQVGATAPYREAAV